MLRHIIIFLIFIVLLAACIFNAIGLDWPVARRILLTSFGENNGNSFYAGIDLGGEHQNIYPVADGDIIFYYKEDDNYSTVPRGNGNLLVLQHEGGIQSIYSHLEKDSLNLDSYIVSKRPYRISAESFEGDIINKIEDEDLLENMLAGFLKENDYYFYNTEDINETEQMEIWDFLSSIDFIKPIARIGDSGAAEGPYLFFMLIDISEHIIINPIFNEDNTPLLPQILPRNPRNYDGPIIENLFINRDNKIEEISEGIIISSGFGDIFVKVYCISDFSDYEKRIVPYRFTLISSGIEVASIVLNALEEQENRFVIWNTDIGYSDLYNTNIFEDQWLFKLGSINFFEGVNNISLTVEDIYGFETRFDVQLKIE